MVSLAANWDPAGRRECNDAHLHGGIELDDRPDLLRGWRRFDYGHRIPIGNTGSRMIYQDTMSVVHGRHTYSISQIEGVQKLAAKRSSTPSPSLRVGNPRELPPADERAKDPLARPTNVPQQRDCPHVPAVEIRVTVVQVATATQDLRNGLEGAGG